MIVLDQEQIYAIINSEHSHPHNILGFHKIEDGLVINAFIPHAKKVKIKDLENNQEHIMDKIDEAGFFTVHLININSIKYKYLIEGYTNDWEMYDPYSFSPVLTDMDMHLFGEGTHYEIYNKLGAHPMSIDEIEGVLFAVWAPNAKRVSVVGDFNGWDGRIHPMRSLSSSGIFEIFIPSLQEGEIYKFEIKAKDNSIILKSDPYGNYSELRPKTASKIYDINKFKWNDNKWIERRNHSNLRDKPIAIYEVHLGSWKKGLDNSFLDYKEIAHQIVDYVKEMGYTHIELLPITEYPYDASWGYQVTGYYAPTSRYGTPNDFMYFVNYCHKHDIGVILDWVPAHFPKDEHALIKFDGTALYEHVDPKQGEHVHWGTMIFNFQRKEVVNFLIANALFWFDKYHIDGLRVDAVSSMLYLNYGKEEGEWIPNKYGGKENLDAIEFIKHLNSISYKRFPGIMMMAEESTAWANVSKPTDVGGLGFEYKWNMGWMNDTLMYMRKDPVYRKYHHNDLTFSFIYVFSENYILSYSHDEVVHGKGSLIGKMPGDYDHKFANLRLAYAYMYGHPGKKLLFMGQEFAQFSEWNYQYSIDWHLLEYEKHRQLQGFVKELNYFYKCQPSLYKYDFSEVGFEWINGSYHEKSILIFIRKTYNPEDTLILVYNFTPTSHENFKIGVPYECTYKEVFNSDDEKYGGWGVINKKETKTKKEEWDGREYNISINIPPLAVSILKPIF